MKRGRKVAAAATLNGKIHVMGGFDQKWKKLNSAEQYNPDKDSWMKIANMNVRRFSFSACVIDNQLFAVGGGGTEKTNDPNELSVEAYNGNVW